MAFSTLVGRGPIEFQVKTANYTVLQSEVGTGFRNTGAAGEITFSLPAALAGMHYYFYVDEAQELRIDPNGTETISLPSSGVPQAAGAYLTANAVGESVHIVCPKDGTWAVMGYTGTWTAV
jgi:hypothetical protein